MKKNLKPIAGLPESLPLEVVFGMLESAIGGLVENEICSYCKIRFDEEAKSKACASLENCEGLVFEGLLESQGMRGREACFFKTKEWSGK